MGPFGLPPDSPRPSRFASIKSVVRHVRNLSPGDALIAALLGIVFLAFCFSGLYALERAFLVEIPSRGGSLSEGVVGSPRFINPLLALSDADRDLVMLTYAGLMGYAADGTLVPVLAERYEVSEDGKTYTFVLAEHARFSDGRSVTAADVVFTVEKAQDPGLKSPELQNWANIRAEAVDARTVRFTLPAPYAPFLFDATLGILPSHLWRDVSNEEFPFSTLSENPVGAGPFRPTNIERDGTGAIVRYELAAFDDFALGRPHLNTIRFIYFEDEEALSVALRNNVVESGYGLPEISGAQVYRVPYARVFGVFWNAAENLLYARAEVRQALSTALDREALINDVLGGYGTAAYGPVPPGSISDPYRPEAPENRILAAAEILEDAGWEYDVSLRQWNHAKESKPLSIILSTAHAPELKAVAEHVRRNWEQLGVPVEIKLYDPGSLAQNVIRPRAYEALFFGMAVGRTHDLFAFWDSSGRQDPGLNVALYASRAVDELLEEIREETDPEKRAIDLAKLDRLIALDYPAAFTHAPEFVYHIPKDLRGVRFGEVATPADRFSGVHEWYRRTEFVWPVFAPPQTTRE